MNTMMLLLSAIAILFLLAVAVYNRLVKYRNRYKNAFSQIDVQLKRRYDLIPNLVNSVKGYMKHEQTTLEAVIKARNQAYAECENAALQPGAPESIRSLSQAENVLGSALGRLMMLSESYPELKADKQVTNLMEALTSTENKVAYSRQGYNDMVTIYNTARESFPANLIATMFHFEAAELLVVIQNEREREVPSVEF
ncbi:LemA family protein [Deltaproteobacteria bacterium TL4]